MTAFLNDFDARVRSRLAMVDSKIAKLERQVQLIELTLFTVDNEEASHPGRHL